MLHIIAKTSGRIMVMLCLVSTLAIAQSKSPSQMQAQKEAQARTHAMAHIMTCTKVDVNGTCIEAQGQDGKTIVIEIEGVKVGEALSCAPSCLTIACTKAEQWSKLHTGAFPPYAGGAR
jgi:hypothetical protein